MTDQSTWQGRIEAQIKRAEERQRLAREHRQERMDAVEHRWHRFEPLAERILQAILRPRMEVVAGYFDNTEWLPDALSPRYHTACRFRPTERFPATVLLDLSVGTDGRAENLVVRYRLEILPKLFPFPGQSLLILPLDAVDEGQIAAWTEERLESFVGIYLSLEDQEAYQEENLVTDPVCGMRLHKGSAVAREIYQGVAYYFCVEHCREQFVKDPDHYAAETASDSPVLDTVRLDIGGALPQEAVSAPPFAEHGGPPVSRHSPGRKEP
jgi:YHS domain-containing protein